MESKVQLRLIHCISEFINWINPMILQINLLLRINQNNKTRIYDE